MNISDAKDWLGLGQQIVPWIALLVAVCSCIVSARSLRLSKEQSVERRPNLDIGLNDLWFSKNADESRTYTLDISINNRASSANSIIRLELIIIYSLNSGHEIKLRRSPDKKQDSVLPIRLDAFGSVIKAFIFSVEKGTIPEDAKIESYSFEITESSGAVRKISPGLIIERKL